MSLSCEKFIFVVNNLSPLKDEEYVWCLNDFLTRVTFESKGIDMPHSTYKDYAGSWAKIEEELNTHELFGKQFKTRYFKKEELQTLTYSDTSNLSRLRSIYYMVRSKVKPNNEYTIMAYAPKEALRKGIGTSGEINAILLSTLLDVGFDAYPVVMSLRSRGRLPITHPTLDRLNYFIVGVNIGDETYYLDAMSQYGDINVLPLPTLVENARTIRSPFSSWVNLSTIDKSHERLLIKAQFNEQGILSGDVTEGKNLQFGYIFHNKWANEKEHQKYIEKIESSQAMQISDFKVSGIENTAAPVVCTYHFEIPDIKVGDERIYINPLIIPLLTKNPFKVEERKLPVEFPFPSTQTTIVKITIPEGYTIEEMPKSFRLSFGDKGDITVVYRIIHNNDENTIDISMQYMINKIVYMPQEYPFLRDFYSRFTTQNESQIILKKI